MYRSHSKTVGVAAFNTETITLNECHLSLEATHLGALPFTSRVSLSPPRSSLLPTPVERGKSYDSLFDNTPSPSPAPSFEQSDRDEDSFDGRKSSASDLDTAETWDEEGSDTVSDDNLPEGPYVVDIRNDEDDEDEKEVEELLRLDLDDDETLSTNSRATTPLLDPPTPQLVPVSTLAPSPAPSPSSTFSPILDRANTAAPSERVQYRHKITYPTGKFEHLVVLNRDEPIPRFEYSLEETDRFNSHLRVNATKRQHEKMGAASEIAESETENEYDSER